MCNNLTRKIKRKLKSIQEPMPNLKVFYVEKEGVEYVKFVDYSIEPQIGVLNLTDGEWIESNFSPYHDKILKMLIYEEGTWE